MITPGTNHRRVDHVVADVIPGANLDHLVEPQDPRLAEFKLWRQAVSALVRRTFGVSLSDLPDMTTRDAFDQGISPESFFQEEVVSVAREEFGNEAVDAALGQAACG